MLPDDLTKRLQGVKELALFKKPYHFSNAQTAGME